jgi:hypothetical protein
MSAGSPDPSWVVNHVAASGSVEIALGSIVGAIEDWHYAVSRCAEEVGLSIVFFETEDIVTVVDAEH